MDALFLIPLADEVSLFVTIWSIVASIIAIISSTKKIVRNFRYRHIKRILGLRDGERVNIICSELDNPEQRQMVEEREYIYLMKYGDLDAWVEVVVSLLRIYPNIDIQLLSSGEALSMHTNLEHQMIVIGGPDYNGLVRRLIDDEETRFSYDLYDDSDEEAICLVDRSCGARHYFPDDDNDYGYIEKIRNPFNKNKNILLFGGCHTVGVTAATKFISAFTRNKKGLSRTVLQNSAAVCKAAKGNREGYSILIHAKKVGSNVTTPLAEDATYYAGMRGMGMALPKGRQIRARTIMLARYIIRLVYRIGFGRL